MSNTVTEETVVGFALKSAIVKITATSISEGDLRVNTVIHPLANYFLCGSTLPTLLDLSIKRLIVDNDIKEGQLLENKDINIEMLEINLKPNLQVLNTISEVTDLTNLNDGVLSNLLIVESSEWLEPSVLMGLLIHVRAQLVNIGSGKHEEQED